MWRPILQQKAKKQTNQTTKKQEKTNLNYLKFLAFLMQTEPFWILMNIYNFNFEGSNSSQLTRKCFEGVRFFFFLCANSLLVISKSTSDNTAFSRIYLVSEGGERLFCNLTQFHSRGKSFGIPPGCLPQGASPFEIKPSNQS